MHEDDNFFSMLEEEERYFIWLHTSSFSAYNYYQKN